MKKYPVMIMPNLVTKLMFGFCSHLPIRLELRKTREEERMERYESECSNNYRREEVHSKLEG